MFAITRAFLSNAKPLSLPRTMYSLIRVSLASASSCRGRRHLTLSASRRGFSQLRGIQAGLASGGQAPLSPVRRCILVPYDVPVGEERAVAITASEARKKLFPLIEQVNDDRQPVEITSKRGDAVLMSRVDYDALQETAYLLRVPANARRLLESLRQSLDGQREEHEIT